MKVFIEEVISKFRTRGCANLVKVREQVAIKEKLEKDAEKGEKPVMVTVIQWSLRFKTTMLSKPKWL